MPEAVHRDLQREPPALRLDEVGRRDHQEGRPGPEGARGRLRIDALRFGHYTSDDGTAVVLTVTQTQSADWPTFRLPLKVEIRGPDGVSRERIEVTQRSQTFTIPVAGRPDEVVLDPDGWVLKGG